MGKYWKGAHTKHRLIAHLVWIPKYRKRILKGQLAERIEELIRDCIEVNGWAVEELNVQSDHVHLVLQFPPTIALCKIFNLIKGKSSRIIMQEFPELKEKFWGGSFWADGYFCSTVGDIDIKAVKEYVRNQ